MGEQKEPSRTSEDIPLGLVAFDIEADGFLPDATKIHCIAARHVSSRREWFFSPDDIEAGIEFLCGCEVVIAAYGFGYDYPLINKLYPEAKLPLLEDSVILSRLANPDRHGGHSIESWGVRFKQPKPEHEDWSTYTPAMGNRCQEDVRILVQSIRVINHELANHDWADAIHTEYQIQALQTKIEERGVRLSDKVYEAADELDRLTSETHGILTDSLPLLVQPKGAPVVAPFTRAGKLAKRVVQVLGCPMEVEGPFCGVRFVPLNLDSPKQLTEFLLGIGWEPTEFNYKKAKRGGYELNDDGTYVISSPKVTEDSLEPLDHPVATHLKDYRVLKHRLSILRHTTRDGRQTGWCNTVRADHRVEARAIPLGTNTHRYTHSNIVNLPTVGTAHSEYIRSMLVASEGKVCLLYTSPSPRDRG